jgi:hypothetical protein
MTFRQKDLPRAKRFTASKSRGKSLQRENSYCLQPTEDDLWPQSCLFKNYLSLNVVLEKYFKPLITKCLEGGRAQNTHIPKNVVTRKP